MNRLWTYFALLLLVSCAAVSEPETVEYNGYRFVHMDTERLPDMSVPRQYYLLLNLNGEFTAIGGHTTGFVLTQTAEYYKNGKWNQLPLLYNHDDPFCAVLPDGRVMVGGGYEKDFGIGQTWGAEESGFANEGSFFRSFKKLTGLTPSEWKENIITRR